MKTFLSSMAIAIFAVGAGMFLGAIIVTGNETTRLGTAVCKHLSSKFARLDGDPVCVTPAGIMRFYEKD